MIAFALALLASSAAAPRADTPAAAIASVRTLLKDPDSATFKGVIQTSPGYWCGWVNAKNSYGGFTGFSVFYYHGGKASLIPAELSEPKLCAK